MSIFQNNFFSIAGQVERVTNAAKTVAAAVSQPINTVSKLVTGKSVLPETKVQANTANKTLNTVLEAAANHPLTTAALITPAGTGLVKSAVSKVATSFTGAKLGTQLAVSATALVGTGLVTQSPKTATAIVKTPSSLVNFGSNIGKAIENPSLKTAANIAKENPVLTAATTAAAALVVGKAAGTVANLVATNANTRAVTEGNKIAEAAKNLSAGETALLNESGTSRIKKLTESEQAAYKAQKEQREYELELAKLQVKAQEEQAKAALEIAKVQSQSTAAAVPSPVTPLAVAPTPKKKATKKKKKAKSKKKSTKHKYKRRYRDKNGQWHYVY